MTSLTARRLSPPDTTVVATEIALCGVAAVCDLVGALYLPDLDTLVVSDLHLEKGAAFARRGQLLPPYDTLATLRLLDGVVTRYQPKTVISLGDNFHDRAGSALMPLPFREMILATARGRDFIWINGNHDPDGTTDLPGISADEITLASLTFRHEPSLAHGKGEVAGHLHPSATVRRRKNPCAGPASPPMATVW